MRTFRIRLKKVDKKFKDFLCALFFLTGTTFGADTNFSYPDERSYFPLLLGSYWKYEDVIDNEATSNGGKTLTVTSLQKTDSGYIAKVRVTRTAGVTSFDLVYYCDRQGFIYKRLQKESDYELVGMLRPTRTDALIVSGEKQFYSKCCETCDSTCLKLQNYDLDGGQEPAPNQVWHGKWFVRGIGIVTEGMSESGYNLVEYRIGKGPVIKKRWATE